MKKMRKGFTLVELLIVIAIIATLSAAMSVSGSNANAAAKASTIYTNINAIKTAAVLYQLQQGDGFKETNVTAANLKEADLIDLDEYNGKNTITEDENTITTYNNIVYAIQQGTAASGSGESATSAKGAYVICKFADDGDYTGIAKALAGYKNIRIDSTNNTVGAFLYHNTPKTKGSLAYDTDFSYPSE